MCLYLCIYSTLCMRFSAATWRNCFMHPSFHSLRWIRCSRRSWWIWKSADGGIPSHLFLAAYQLVSIHLFSRHLHCCIGIQYLCKCITYLAQEGNFPYRVKLNAQVQKYCKAKGMHASGSQINIAAISDPRLRYHQRVGVALATGGQVDSNLLLEAATNSSSTSASSQQMAKMEAYRKKLAQLPTYQQYHGVSEEFQPPTVQFKTFGFGTKTNSPLSTPKSESSPNGDRHTSHEHLPYSPGRNTVTPFVSNSVESAAGFGIKSAHSVDYIPQPARPPNYPANLMHSKLADLREPPPKVYTLVMNN